MKHIIFFLFISTTVFAQTPRLKFRQIQKDTVKGSVLISSSSDSGMVYSRDFYVAYGVDTLLILYGDTIGGVGGGFASVLSDGVTITGDGTTGNELKVDTATVISTIQGLVDSLSNYVNISGTQTITGAKTFSTDVEIDGKLDLDADGNSVFIGTGAGVLDDGSDNWSVGIGYQALNATIGGNNNTAVGYRSLFLNESSSNTAVGYQSLRNNTSGYSNTSIGHLSLYSLSSGFQNVSIGREAGRYYGTGTGENTDSDNSVFIGYDTRPLADAQTNQIVIGYDAIGLGSNSVVLGNSAITKTRLQGDVGIGTDSPSADLDVVGDVEVNGNLTVTGTINNEPTYKQLSLGEGYADNIREFYYDNSITVHPSNLGYSYAELIKEDLLNEASLILTPTATSVGKLYTQKPLGTSDAFAFVRNSTSTRVNSLGLIETVPDSVPRIDYTDGEPSLLLEPSRTNLNSRS